MPISLETQRLLDAARATATELDAKLKEKADAAAAVDPEEKAAKEELEKLQRENTAKQRELEGKSPTAAGSFRSGGDSRRVE